MPRGKRIADDIALGLELAVIDLAIDITAETVDTANKITPVDTGELIGSARVTLNMPSRDASARPYIPLTGKEIRKSAQLLGMSIGDSLVLTWVAGHALIIEGGRRPDRRGRMIGSEQAPRGFFGVSLKKVLARR